MSVMILAKQKYCASFTLLKVDNRMNVKDFFDWWPLLAAAITSLVTYLGTTRYLAKNNRMDTLVKAQNITEEMTGENIGLNKRLYQLEETVLKLTNRVDTLEAENAQLRIELEECRKTHNK